jgi:hypothetical protein
MLVYSEHQPGWNGPGSPCCGIYRPTIPPRPWVDQHTFILRYTHRPNIYKTPNPMSSLLVFNRVCRLEILSVVLVFFDPSCELAPLQPSHWFASPTFPV